MTNITNNNSLYDLEERTYQFAKAVRLFVKTLPKTITNSEAISLTLALRRCHFEERQ